MSGWRRGASRCSCGRRPPRSSVAIPTWMTCSSTTSGVATAGSAGSPARPGSAWATKRWTPAGFAAVAAAVEADRGRCGLLGRAADRPLVEAIRAASGGRAVGLAGRTDVATLVAVIDRLALLIANDSAPMHVACARGVPVVAVFCATTPALGYGPWGSGHTVLGADLACRPCARHGGRRCPRGTEDCMHLAEPAAVLAAAVVDATTSGAAAYRIARALELRGVTLRLPGAPIRLARRDTARLHVGAGASLALGASVARVGRVAARLVIEEAGSLEEAVEALDADAAALAALLHALRVRPRFSALAVAPLAGAAPVLAARGGPLGWGRWIAAVLAGYRAFVVQAKLWEARAEGGA